jgi:toxin secretion/phage lysis holin
MKQFLTDYHHSYLNQLLFDVGLGVIVATIAQFISTYIFADIEFVKWLAVLIVIDTILGFIDAVSKGKVSSKGFGMIIKKIIAYGVVLCVIHILTNFKVEGTKNELFNWFTQIGYSALVVRESISILENSGKFAPNLIPAWILKRLKAFDKSGKPEDLHGDKETA